MESLFELATQPALPFYPCVAITLPQEISPDFTPNLSYAYKLLNCFEMLVQFIPEKRGKCREVLLREERVPRRLSASCSHY
jgi:hypothetical protein